MRRSLTRDERIRAKKDFERLFTSPHRCQTVGMKLFYRPSSRVAFAVVAGRGFKKAVMRNKNKRWLRELFRNWKVDCGATGEYLFVVQPGQYDFASRRDQFQQLVSKIKAK